MNKNYLLFFLFALGLSTAKAQTFVSDTTAKQFVTTYGQTFTHTFTALPAGGYGLATLVVYFEGDLGASSEYGSVNDEDANFIGYAGPYSSGQDCAPKDSVYIYFSAALIDTWMLDNQVNFTISPNGDVDPGECPFTYFQCKLIYNYCSTGYPFDFANFTLSQSEFCSYDAGITLTGSPSTGFFTGPGVVNNTFSPAGLTPGSTHTITYTAYDQIGCETKKKRTVKIKRIPEAADTHACPGTQPALTATSGGTNIWYYNQQLTQVIGTMQTVLAAPIYETTNYYVATLYNTSTFKIDSLSVYDSLVVDHNLMAGNDRGGIAVTPNYIFVVGDDNTVRANAADLTGQVSLPIQDGLFSDLKNGALYTLWNTALNVGPTATNSFIEINAIRGLDDNMALTAEINQLSTPFTVDDGSIIFTGVGYVGVFSSNNNHVYIINLNDFEVTDLGVQVISNYYGSENWASWGVLEYDGADFYGLCRVNTGPVNKIMKRNFTTGVETLVKEFPAGISDLSSFTVSPWNNRWYFHYENASGTFGGNTETMGYASAGSTITALITNQPGCYAEIEVIVNQIDLGSDTTLCQQQAPLLLTATAGYGSYSWNGVNNNLNTFAVSQSGVYIVNGVDSYNCILADTIVVTFDACLGVDELTSSLNATLYPNPTSGSTTLSINVQVSSQFTVQILDVSGKMIEIKEVNVIAGNNEININTESIQSGVYLLTIDNAELGRKTIRFVKN